MGMTASQARFLTLTARKNNLEFEIQQTTQAKMLLAQQQDANALLWSNGMNTQHLYYSADGTGSVTEDMPRLSYQIVTSTYSEGGLDMRVRDQYNRIVVPSLPDPFPEDDDIANYVIEPNCLQADYFEENIKTGNWMIQQIDPANPGEWTDVSVAGSTFIYQGADSTDFQIAAADYDAEVDRLESIDKRFDMRIQQLSTEQKAIETEMDSVKKVIDKNIEETFKTFG